MTENLIDEQKVEDLKKKEQLEEKQLRKDIRKITKDKAGIRFFRWFFEEAAPLFRTSLSSDPYEMARNEGNRSVGLRVLDKLGDSVPERISQIMPFKEGK